MTEVLTQVRELMAKQDMPAVLIVSPTDLQYLTGIAISRGTMLITQQRACLFIDPRYLTVAKQLSSDVEVFCHPSAAVLKLTLEKEFKAFKGTIGFDATTMTVDKFFELSSVALPGQLISTPAVFSHLRRPKRPDEIKAIQEACRLCEQGFTHLLEKIHEGITERELAAALKAYWFAHDAEAVSFEPIIAFGPNSACPHWASSATPLVRNVSILIDIGVKYHSYHSDMTRTIFFGRPDPELVVCHTLVQEAYALAFAQAKPGVSPVALDTTARQFLASHGYGEAFVHGLGHGVGMEVHEMPKVSAFAPDEEPLEEGDVITIEPGIYLEGLGGIRLENTVVIEAAGARALFSLTLEPVCL